MANSPNGEIHSRHLSVANRVDTVCDAFENALRAGQAPQIEDFLQDVESSEREQLLAELLAIELEYCVDHGTETTIADWETRFPDQTTIVRNAFERLNGPTKGPSAGTVLPGISQEFSPPSLPPRYRLLQEHARGGFGAVWQAHDLRLGRDVAIKCLSSTQVPAELRQRFVHEAQLTARLEHPGIVPIYDLEHVDAPRPFYAMKFVRGETLSSYIRQCYSAATIPDEFSIQQRQLLEYLLGVIRTIAFAHSKNVIHRDLKPANIIVGEYGECLILDWGLAKHLGTDDDTSSDASLNPREQDPLHTQSGSVLGTPAYMAPEQAGDNVNLVGKLSDVYALGSILYHILCGQTQFAGVGGVTNILTCLKNSERPIPPRELKHTVPPALNAICQKAMCPDACERYDSADAMANDLEAFFADRKVSAYKEPWTNRLARVARRHRRALTSLSAVGVVCLLALSLMSWMLSVHNRQLSEANSSIAEEQQAATENLYFHQVSSAYDEYLNNNLIRADALLTEAPSELRHWEWHYVSSLCESRELVAVRGHDSSARCGIFSPDNKHLITAGGNKLGGTVKVWSLPAGDEILALDHGIGVYSVAINKAGTIIASAGATRAEGGAEIKLWDFASGELLHTWTGFEKHLYGVTFSPDGATLAAACGDKKVYLYNVENREQQRILAGHTNRVTKLAYSADGEELVSVGWDGTARVWNTADGEIKRVIRAHRSSVASVAVSLDGRRLATGGGDQTVRIWEWDEIDEPPRTLVGHTDRISCVNFSPDGRELVSTSVDGLAIVWDARRGREKFRVRGHTSHVRFACYSHDGKWLATASDDETVRVWPASGPTIPMVSGTRVAYSTTGEHVVSCLGKSAAIFVVGDDDPLQVLKGHDGDIVNLQTAPGQLATSSLDKTVKVWSVPAGQLIHTLQGHEDVVQDLAFSPDGNYLATVDRDGRLGLWNTHSGEQLHMLQPFDCEVYSVAISANNLVAAGSEHGGISLWDVASGKHIGDLVAHQQAVIDLRFCPATQKLASVSWDGRALTWKPEDSGKPLLQLEVGTKYANALAFSPDGERLVTGSENSLKIWDAHTGRAVVALRLQQSVWDMAFSPDGQTLAWTGPDKKVRFFGP